VTTARPWRQHLPHRNTHKVLEDPERGGASERGFVIVLEAKRDPEHGREKPVHLADEAALRDLALVAGERELEGEGRRLEGLLLVGEGHRGGWRGDYRPLGVGLYSPASAPLHWSWTLDEKRSGTRSVRRSELRVRSQSE
jgi:hypothetical protein